MPAQMRAVVKSVLSGDTVILRGRPTNGQPPKERTLHLAGLTTPRTGSRDRPEESWAFEAREFVRQMLVGKEVAFSISYTIPSGGEFGAIYLMDNPTSPLDVALEVVKNGWAKLRDSGKFGAVDSDDLMDGPEKERRNALREYEEKAKQDGLGIWADSKPSLEVNYSMPEDPAAFLSEHKGKSLDAIIESVSNGTTVRARLLLRPDQHQFITLTMAGVRAPRARFYNNATNESGTVQTAAEGEPFGDEARYFTECRLLHRKVTVILISLPTPQATNLASQTQTQQSMTVSSLIGIVQHPAGSIAALLLANGLARVIDWHAGFLSSVPEQQGGGMERLRKAEKEGKEAKRGLWKTLAVASNTAGSANGNPTTGSSGKMKFEGTVARVWSVEILSIRVSAAPGKSGTVMERKVQLSSIRPPRPTDPKLGGLAAEARELLRRRLIGKQVQVSIDYIRPKEGDYEERECATVKLPTGINVANLLVERGYANVLRHRQGEDRSSEYDQLMASEMKAQTEGKGLHSGKEFPVPKITDVSENSNRANSYLSGWKRQGRMAGVVDFVASGSRFKIWFPKQDLKFTLVLSAIKCPKTARHPGERNEPFGAEALDYVNQLALQKDVEIEVEATDKSGGFIGSLYLNKTDNLSIMLVREGLASCNDFSLDRSPFGKELKAAEEEAKKLRKNLWRDLDEQATQPIPQSANGVRGGAVSANKEYIDIIVSDVREPTNGTGLTFSVQILKNGGIPELTQLMSEFSVHHRSAPSAPNAGPYRTGDLVSAKFSADNAWYRAKIRKNAISKKEAEVIFIDYGNSETVPHSNLRPLDVRFKTLPAQAKEATLSFVKLLGSDSEYGQDAADRFRSLVEGRTLVANVDYRDPTQNGLLHLSLYEPTESSTATASINHTLVRDGYAAIDNKATYRSAYPDMYRALETAKNEAKRNRAGAYEFGDAFDD
ncbi:hypothetical protein CROQUDRAFT_658503 [Cronartium quercuum f. sp. fusiforme G11]|uniref:Transcription factor n=1 Tax=Cronartium quercuum f. sp. fusiforme G11 TaxID=708437 RepID=A0A9P6NK21_9BASI|nr:hypothetical protein CROQUDRAFT_658503 [Cronartium quercuum f. sp. fusiforme G11]